MMTISNSVDQITKFLADGNIAWLLPNLRQDFVVWNSLNNPEFLDKVIQWESSRDSITPSDLSPINLAFIGLDQYQAIDGDKNNVLSFFDKRLLQSALRSFNDQSYLDAQPQNLETAALIALAIFNQYLATHSWVNLVDAIHDNPGSLWLAPISCLFGLVPDSTFLLPSLVQPGASSDRIELAVHAVLSNPLPPQEQLEILTNLCLKTNNEPLPARERLLLVRSINEQRPETAKLFCSKWTQTQPQYPKAPNGYRNNPSDNLRRLEEILFEIEVNQIAGNDHTIIKLLEEEKRITQSAFTGFKIHNLSQVRRKDEDRLFLDELTAINTELIQFKNQQFASEEFTEHQAEIALILAEQGYLAESNQVIPAEATNLPDDPGILYAVAKVSKINSDIDHATSLADRIVSILEQTANRVAYRVWGNSFSLINLGKLLLDLHKPDSAIHVLELACRTCPNNHEILRLLAESYLISHKEREASEVYRNLVSLNPGVIDYHRAFAKSLESIDEWEACFYERSAIIRSYQEKEDTLPIEDRYAYARAALKANHLELTLSACDEILAHDPNDYTALIYTGNAYLRGGDADKGMENFNRATQVAPYVADTWLALAAAQETIYPIETIIDTLLNATQAVPDSPQILYKLGELYLLENAPTLALPVLKFAQELSPDDPQILYSYGRTLIILGHSKDGNDVLSKAYQLDPSIPGLAQLYASILVKSGEFERAIPPLESLINQRSSSDLKPYMDYAKCILILHKNGSAKYPPMKALIALNEVIQIDPGYSEARALIAETLAANGDKEIAFQSYREVLDTPLIEDKEWRERLSYGFGILASSLGKYDIAIAALQEAGQANPVNPGTFKALSDAYLLAKLHEDAMRSARNVLIIDGENPDNLAWFAMQVTNISLAGKSDSSNSINLKSLHSEALNALNKAIQLAPTRTDLLVQLGNFQASAGALADARIVFTSIADHEFARIDDLKSASAYLSNIGDHEAAIRCLETGILQDRSITGHKDASLYAMLSNEHVKNNDHVSALNVLDNALEFLPAESSLISLKIDILLGLSQPIDALNCIETAISVQPIGKPNPELLFLASKINRSIGDLSSSIKYARKAIDTLSTGMKTENLSTLPLPFRTQLAEIYRALIQPDEAFKNINPNARISASDFDDEEDYLDFICLHTELALETSGKIRPDIQDIQLEPSNPGFSRLMAITARLMNRAGNFKQAEQLLQVAENSFNTHIYETEKCSWAAPHFKYLTTLSIAEAAMELGDWILAESCAQKVIESAPNEPLSYLTLVKTIILKAEFSNLCEISHAFKHIPSKTASSNEIHNQLALYFDKVRSISESYKDQHLSAGDEFIYDQIFRWQARAGVIFHNSLASDLDIIDVLTCSNFPDDAASAIYHLHQLDLASPDRESINRIIKIARTYSRNPSVLLQLALAIYDDNPEDAMKSLQAVLEQNPIARNPTIAFCNVLLAKIAFKLDQPDIAEKGMEIALTIWPDEPEWHILSAQVLIAKSDNSAAINHYCEATKLAPMNIGYHLNLGKAYFQNLINDSRMLKQANNTFETALTLDENNVDALILLATTQSLLNDVENAEKNARNALALAPDRADAYQLLSEISIKLDDFQGAYEYANNAIRISPKDVQSTIILARSLSALGRHNEAISKLDAMVPVVTDPHSLQLERVNIIRKINGPRAALNELRILADSSSDFNILFALAKSYVEILDPGMALDVARQALQASTDKTPANELASLHLLIGQTLRQSGQLDQSIDHLNQAVHFAPDRLEPYLELGLARKEQRDYQQALQIFEQATSIDPDDPRAPFQAGLALKESKDYKSSETMLRRAVNLAPHDPIIRRQLAAVVALNLVHNPRTGRN